MPCGKFDKRRGGHRCVACRRAHGQCDGSPRTKKACSYCTSRLLKCSYSSSANMAFQLVQVDAAPAKAIVLDTWRFITACFDKACGTLPILSVMRSDGMLSLAQGDQHVHQMAALMGEVYLSRMAGHDHYMRQRKRFEKVANRQKRISFWASMSPGTPLSPSLACAIMSIMVESSLDPTLDPGGSSMAAVSNLMAGTGNSPSLPSSFDKDVMQMIQLADVVNSITRCQRPMAPDMMAGRVLRDHSEKPDRDREPFLLSSMWQWAVLQQKMVEWVYMSENDEALSTEQVSGEIEIVQSSLALQNTMLQLYAEVSDPLVASSAIAPLSYWVYMGISMHLQHPAWSRIGQDLQPPGDPEEHRQRALSTLDWIKRRAPQAGFGAVMFLPVILYVGTQMVTVEDREYVLQLLEKLEPQCYEVCRNFRVQLSDLWAREM